MPELSIPWHAAWTWLGASLLAMVAYANIAWFFRQPRPGRFGELISRLIGWRFSLWLQQTVRLLVYVGLPFAALVWGHDAVTRSLMGLQTLDLPVSDAQVVEAPATVSNWLDWVGDVGWAAILGISALGLLVLGWWAYRRALISAGEGRAGTQDPVSGWVLLREAAYHEVHWAFYRNAPILAWGRYWGTWAGLILVAVEATLNPAWRQGLGDTNEAPARLMRGVLAVVSSILFLQTQNLWLAVVLHFAVSAGTAAIARALPLQPGRAPSTSDYSAG